MSIETPKDPLTDLLAALPQVRDRGFTQRVLYRVRLRELRRHVILFTAVSCGLAGIVLSLPLGRLVAPLSKLLQETSAAWAQYASANQIAQALDGYLQMASLNNIIVLSAAGVLLVLATFSLLQD